MLFESLKIKDINLKNRIVMSPMCQYSYDNGFANDWLLTHLGSRAVGGVGLIFTEATAVEARGRISPDDLGIWSDEHILPLKRVVDFVKSQGSHIAIQLAHSGRKASAKRLFKTNPEFPSQLTGNLEPIAPSNLSFSAEFQAPREMSLQDIETVKNAFVLGAKRALDCGFDILEVHAAHGYLLHEFLSPVSNKRNDQYGGSFENRIRFLIETVRSIRNEISERIPLFVRLSATDWLSEPSWNLEQSIELAKILKSEGVDLIDCSSGGLSLDQKIELKVGYQVPFAEAIKKQAHINVGAVGLITEPEYADDILKNNKADLIFLGRELLRNPYWPIQAAQKLGYDFKKPIQYQRA